MITTLQQEAEGLKLNLPTEMAMDISRKIAQSWKRVMDEGRDKVVMLCDSRIRSPLAGMLLRAVPLLPVIAYDEIVLGTNIEPIDTISLQQSEIPGVEDRELVKI